MRMNTNTLLIGGAVLAGGWFLWQHMQRQQRPAPVDVWRPAPAPVPPGFRPAPTPTLPRPTPAPGAPPQFGVRMPLPDWAQQPRLQPLPFGPAVPLARGGDFDVEDVYGSQGAVLQ